MKKIIAFSAIISFFWIAPLAYMYFDNQPPYEYDISNSYITPSKPHAERQVTVHWAFKSVNRICPGSIVRYIIDAQNKTKITYDATPAALSIDLKDLSLDRTFMLPPNVTIGPKIYRSEGFYICNPLQHFWPLRVSTPDLHFEIVE